MTNSVTIRKSASPSVREGQRFDSVQAADYALAEASLLAPRDGCYDKVEVMLQLEEHRLTYRIDLQHPSAKPFPGILEEALEFLEYYGAVFPEQKAQVFVARGFVVAAQMFP